MYVVKYTGVFGFIKPWTAVRDSLTYSQQFLTPSIIEGIEKKLFPELLNEVGIHYIMRHKLCYDAIDIQMEKTQARGWENKTKEKRMVRNQSILNRGVLLNPVLYLCFSDKTLAQRASLQHVCLCRNEDLLFPKPELLELSEEQFAELSGFELRFGKSNESFLVGFNRFDNNSPMYGWLEISGKPVFSL